MRPINDIMRRIPFRKTLGPGIYGTEMMIGNNMGTIVFSIDPRGWEHVSFSPFDRSKTPSWDDMCQLKDIFFDDEEEVIQIHPKKSEYVNLMQNCLHLWRNKNCPLPW